MSIKVAIFYFVQVFASAYALWRGGAPERVVAIAMICAAIASSLAPFDSAHTFRTINVPVMSIDVILFLAMWGIAIFANRYWPIWLAATQLVAIGIHATRAYDPHIVAIAYGRLSGQIAYPMIALLLAGTVRHRLRLAKHGNEPDWTNHGITFLAIGASRSTPAG